MNKQGKLAAVIIALIIVGGPLVYFTYQNYFPAPVGNQNHTGNITITDSLGRTFTFTSPVKRIVSIDPAATATLYALGAYSDLVGGNSLDSYPPNATIPNVGNSYGIDTEEVVNLSAQVVLFYGAQLSKDAMYLNDTLHIPVIVDNPSSFAQIENFTTMLGLLTGKESNASMINEWMNSSLSMVKENVVNVTHYMKVFYYLSSYGGYWTAGNGTFFNQIFAVVHLRNIATANGYYEMSGEEIVKAAPQIIFLDQYVNHSAVDVAPFTSTPAYVNDTIYPVFNDNFFDQPDFRIVYAIFWVVNTIYPTMFLHPPLFPLNLEYPPTSGY